MRLRSLLKGSKAILVMMRFHSEVPMLPVYPDQKPTKRGECASMPRPCPFISCRHHLVELRAPRGRASESHDDRTVNEIIAKSETCSLDVADRSRGNQTAMSGIMSMPDIAAVLGMTRERVRQIISFDAGPRMRDAFASMGESFKLVNLDQRTRDRPGVPGVEVKKHASKEVKAAALEVMASDGWKAAIAYVAEKTGRAPAKYTLYKWRRKAAPHRSACRGKWSHVRRPRVLVNAVLDGAAQGLTHTEIARMTGATTSSIERWVKLERELNVRP